MDFENEIRLLGKDIYQKVTKIVENNKGDDEKLYENAILKLEDGRNMSVALGLGITRKGEIKIWNYHYDEELQKEEGDSFWISPNSGSGFTVSITIYGLDKGTLYCAVNDEGSNFAELPEDLKGLIRNYMTQLSNQIPLLEYDKQATHSISNFTPNAKRQYYIQRYNSEFEKLSETEQTSIPSVQAAVNWWAEMLSSSKRGGSLGNDGDSPIHMAMAQQKFSQISIDETQLAKFKDSLSKAIMTELSKGLEVNLLVDYNPGGILLNALTEAGIAGCKTPVKTSMFISVDSVRVCCGLGGKPEDIFKYSPQEEMKHNR